MSDELGSLVAKLAADLTDLKSGLLGGKAELAGFKTFVSDTVSQVKKILTFAGVTLGLGAIISEVKELGKSILEEGGKVELLKASAGAIAGYYHMSADSVEVYIAKLKEKGITEANAYQATTQFLKAGISVDKLPELADAAKVLGASMGMPLQEAFNSLVTGIVKGTPKQLAEMVPGIREVLQSMSSETKKLLDSTIISGTEKSEILMNATLALAEKLKGSVASVNDSYFSKLNDYKVKVAELKEGLFELVKPIGMAITQEEIKSWDDFYGAVGKNKAALKDLGETIAVYVGRIANFVRDVVGFTAAHKDLLLILLEIKTALTVVKWFSIAEGAGAAAVAVGGLTGQLAALRLALAGPWGLVIAVSIIGIGAALAQTKQLAKTHPEMVGGAEWQPDMQALPPTMPAKDVQTAVAGLQAPDYAGQLADSINKQNKAKEEARRAGQLGKKDHALDAPKGGGKGGGGAEEDLLGEHMKRLEAERRADLAAAADQVAILKATLDQKRALLSLDLASGIIDGATYYAKLQEMEKQETAAALAEIDKKRQAQKAAYADELTVLNQEQAQGKFSPEVGDEKRAVLAAKNRQELAKLDVETTKTRLDGEIKVTKELERQVALKKEYTQKTEDLNLDTAQLLGAISSQEAALQKLYLDWQRTKQEAIKAGADPAYLQALDKNLEAKKADTLYGGYSQQITQGISGLADALMSGGQNLMQTANGVFKGLFNEALKPGLEQLKNLLTQGFKDLFGAAGGGIASAVMGGIGLLGMLLTSGSNKSSFSASSIQSGVTQQAMQGIIAGPSTVPIAEIGSSLQDALVPTNGILSDILNALLRTGAAPGRSGQSGGLQLNLMSYDLFKSYVDKYLATELMKGAPA